MSDIFGNVEPPAWLQRISQPADMSITSKVVGELIGGLADASEIAIQKATDKQSQGIESNWIKELPGSFKEGMTTARLNMLNPLWKIQAQQAQLGLAAQKQAMDAQQSQLDMRKSQMAQWEEDAPKLSKWMSLPYDELLKTPIEVKSTQALTLVERQKAAAARLAMDSTANKVRTSFAEALLGVDDAGVIADIQATPSLPNGQPSPQQIAKLNKWRRDNGYAPVGQKITERKPAAIQLVDEIQKAQDEIAAAMDAGDEEAAAKAQDRLDALTNRPQPMEFDVGGRKVTGVFTPRTGRFQEAKPDAQAKAREDLIKEQRKADIDVAKSRVKELQKALNFDPTDKDLLAQMADAKKELNRVLSAPLPKEAAKETAPVTPPNKVLKYDPATDSLTPK